MQAAPSRTKAVPSKAERALKMKKDARFGARAVAMLSKKNNTVVNSVIYAAQHVYRYSYDPSALGTLACSATRCVTEESPSSREKQGMAELTGRLPNTWLIGPHTIGDIPISAIYAALLTLMIEPVV